MRLAALTFVCSMLTWAFLTSHVASESELALLLLGASVALFLAGVCWLFYVALEPLIRRRWPDSLIAWTRLLSGRFSDPLVGRVLLAGALLGVFAAIAGGVAAARAPGLRGDAADPALPVGYDAARPASRREPPLATRRSPCSSRSPPRCSSSFCARFSGRSGSRPPPSC